MYKSIHDFSEGLCDISCNIFYKLYVVAFLVKTLKKHLSRRIQKIILNTQNATSDTADCNLHWPPKTVLRLSVIDQSNQSLGPELFMML